MLILALVCVGMSEHYSVMPSDYLFDIYITQKGSDQKLIVYHYMHMLKHKNRFSYFGSILRQNCKTCYLMLSAKN